MADRRRRSSPKGSRKPEPRRTGSNAQYYEEIVPEPMIAPHPQQTQQPRYEQPADMRSSSHNYKSAEQQRERERGPAYASSYSSSSSSSYIDISRTFPPNRSGFRAFFTAPSEHRRKLRRRRSSRLFKIGNSSTSSVNSDLAYGTGFIKRPKSRVRSRKGKEIDRERYTEQRYDTRYNDRERERERTNTITTTTRGSEGRDSRGTLSRAATDAEILAIGAGIAKLAKESNKLDLKNARSGKKSEFCGTRETGHGLTSSRGLGPSKISHGSDTFDEDGWESASDGESDNSVDSRLAYDNNTKSRWGFFGRKKKFKPLSQKNTIVDPRLFGPANSLKGIVTQPVGFGEVSSWSSVTDFGQHGGYPSTPGPVESLSNSQQSLQQVDPVPTSDPDIFAAGRASRGSVMSGSEPPSYVSSRPGPIPIQQPQPITPVSQSIYEPIYPTRSDSGGILKKTSGSSRTPSLAQAALVGVAGAAVGAAIASNRDDHKDRQREDELRDRERQNRRESERREMVRESERREAEKRESERRELERRDAERRESERRETERRDLERRDLEKRELERKESERRRDKRSSPDRDDRKDKRRDKDRKEENDRDKKREKRRDETRDDREERREKRREERRSERGSERGDRVEERVDVRPIEERRSERPELVDRRTKSEAAVSTTYVDPFQYQVRESAFPTPTTEIPAGHRTPTVVTVEREPDFNRIRNYSIKDPSSSSEARIEVEYSDGDERYERFKGRESRDDPLHEAEDIYEETKHFTAPIAVAAIGAAIAAEHHRESRSDKRRDERRSRSKGDYDSYDRKPRGREQDRDVEAERIQEEADRAYREIVMARKIASQVIRSRSPSPDPSVVEKYKTKEEEEIVRIVTPPGMEEHKKKGPYDAPNADFQLDHVIEPKEMHIFRAPSVSYGRGAPEPVFAKRDPDAERPRPLLNLVYPTPTPSPMPEKQKEREPTRSPKSKDRDRPKVNTDDVVIGPRGNVVASPTTSTVSKGVTWGENETKHYEVESPSEHRDEFVSAADLPSREVPQEIKSSGSKSKGWGAIAAGIMGAGIGAAVASSSDTSKSSKNKKDDDKKIESAYEYRGVVVEPESPPRRKSPPTRERDQSPPSPGPKPASPRSSRVPGAFDDDLDFTATVAAGLQDTGFDPNIVINDPSFRRRDSPPGSNGPTLYHAPFAETVSDFGAIPPSAVGSVGSGFILGEVASTPRDWQSVSPAAEEVDTPTKLSKKEQKKRDKQRRQSGDVTPLEESLAREVVEEPINDYFVEPKLSKKEQKRRDKEAARQAALAEEQTTPSVAEEIVESPESFFEFPKKSKKPKRSFTSPDEISESSRTVSVPVDAFDDLKNGDDDWTDSKKSKKKKRDSEKFDSPVRSPLPAEIVPEVASSKKSKRDSDRYESPPRSVPVYGAASDVGGVSMSKRDSERFESPPRARDAMSDVGRSSSTKDKSRRASERYESPPRSRDADSEVGRSSSSKDKLKRRSEQYERDPEEVSLPPSTPSEVSRDGDYDDRKSRKSLNRDSGIFSSADRDLSQSVVSADASRYDDSEPRRKKKSRSGRDDYDDTRSVASAPAGDDYDDSRKSSKKKDKEKDKKSGIFSSLFGGSKSEVGVQDDSPKGSKDDDDRKKSKKKRHSVPDSSSIYGALGAESVGDLSRSVSNGSNGKHHIEEDLDDGVRSDGEKRRKSRSRSGSTTSTKKDSFLDNAGILGADVGIAGAAAAAIAAHRHRQSKATNTNNETAERIRSKSAERRPMVREEILDPEITERQFRPSIDPQYGDLLPLPPSDPASPNVEPIQELPELPESRPDTPENERVSREKGISAVRRNLQETPMKSPSQSAVPLVFKMGNRSTPSSPGLVRSSPGQSPATPNAESLGFPKIRPSRPKSWDKSTEYKPLWLPETVARRGSTSQLQDSDNSYPELPPSETTSRSSSLLDFHDAVETPEPEVRSRSESLSLNTQLASRARGEELLDSTQTTPKAATFSHQISGSESPEDFKDATSFQDQSKTIESSSTFVHGKESHSTGKDVVAVAAAAGLVSTLGYFASTPERTPVKSNWVEDLPSVKRDVSPPREEHSGERQLLEGSPSPIDPVTKDRSSYLLRSSPMSRNNDDERDTLHSIQEGESNGTSESAIDIEKEREQALETLSKPREDGDDPFKGEEPADEFIYKSKKDKKKDKKKSKGVSRSSTQNDLSLPESSREVVPEPEVYVPIPAPIEEEPSEEFVTTKSKKDKKKGKGLSRSSTQDDLTTLATGENVVPSPEAAAVDPEPTEEFFMTKSKKDKKKGKGLSRSNTQDDLATFGTSEEVLPESETPVVEETQAADDFFTSKSKKDKKKDKKKNKSVSAWEPEEIKSGTQTPAVDKGEQLLEEAPISRDVQEPEIQQLISKPETISAAPVELAPVEEPSIEAFDDLSMPKSKKDKKKDKKKGKSSSSWEPEESVSGTVTPALEKDNQIFEEPSKSRDLQEPDIQHQLVDEPEIISPASAIPTPAEAKISTPKSKKDKKKDKKKGKSISSWEPESLEDANGEIVSEACKNIPTEPSASRDVQERLVAPVLEETNLAQPFSEDHGREPTDDVSTPKSKKDKKRDKKKGKNGATWDSEPFEDANVEPSPATTAVTPDESGFDEDVAEPDVEEPSVKQPFDFQGEEPSDDFSTSKSKKDKKKDKKKKSALIWEPETEEPLPEASTPGLEEETPITRDFQETYFDQPVVEPQTIVEEPTAKPSEELSAPVAKKDKKKKRGSLLSWVLGADSSEPTQDATEKLAAESSRAVPEPIQEQIESAEQPALEPSTQVSVGDSRHDVSASVITPQYQSRDPEEPTSKEPEVTAADDDFAMPKSKKDKKKDKKKRTSLAWEPEPDVLQQPEEETQQSIPEIPIPKSIFERQETSVNTPPELPTNVPIQEPSQELHQASVDLPISRDIEDPSELLLPSTEPEIVGEAPPVVTEELDSWSAPQSKKDKKKSKKNKAVLTWPEDEVKSGDEQVAQSGKVVSEPEQLPVREGETPTSAPEINPAPALTPTDQYDSQAPEYEAKSKAVDEDPVLTTTEKSFQSTPSVPHIESIDTTQSSIIHEDLMPKEETISKEMEQPNDFTPKSKKDKKRDKKKGTSALAWEAEEEQSGSQTPPASLEVSRDVSEQPSAVEDSEQLDTFPTSKSKKDKKKDKKKGKSIASWDEPESEQQVTVENPIGDIRDVTEELPTPIPALEEKDQFSVPKSKKDKKKDKKKGKSSSWEPDPEPQVEEPIVSETPISETREAIEEMSTAPAEPEEDFAATVTKKDKKKGKKGKAFSSWDPEPEPELHPEGQAALDVPIEESRDVVEHISTAPTEPEDSFATFVTKKDKKGKKAKSSSSWQPEPEPHFQEPVALETPATLIQDVLEPTIPVLGAEEELPTFTSKKNKKDKKKSKSSQAWGDDTTEQEPQESQPILPELNRELVEEPSSISFGAIVPQDDISSKSLEQDSAQQHSEIPLPQESTVDQQSTTVHHASQDASTLDQGLGDTYQSQESFSNVPKQSMGHDPTLPIDQNAISQEIVSETKPLPEDMSLAESSAREVQTDAQFEPETAMPDEFTPFETKKGKKKKKGKSMTWEADEEAVKAEDASQDLPPNSKETVQEKPIQEEFVAKSSKKDKKKKGKSTSTWEAEPEPPIIEEPEASLVAPEIMPDQARDAPAEEESGFTESKQGKKKKNKSVSAWEPEPTSSIPSDTVQEKPVESFEESTTSSKKGKKKSKKSQTWDVNDEIPKDDVSLDKSKAEERETTLPVEEALSAKPTPMGGPGAMPITPATPMTGGEVVVPSDKSRDYFPSSSALLPVAAIEAVIFGAEAIHDESITERDISAEPASSKSLNPEQMHLSGSELETKPVLPDGLAAGYDNDQLSLARQLQEEFGSGSKKSKKDKSKRKSLPTTPARQISRSRAVDDLSEDHHRARSLSIEPLGARSGASPGTSDRPNLYSEDQLELARQLKEEFGSGSKKSKKDKKKKRDFSEEPGQDFEHTPDVTRDPQALTADVAIDTPQLETAEVPRGDGFAAGYQEDQLSLARQLQAEFGKKSKKDKKRHSTSQIPLEQETAVDNSFGGPSQPQYTEPLQLEPSQNIPEPASQEKEITRDGLAVGYSEDQLELARQLKEEFGTVSKKKSSKKDKKRQSLLRGTTEDDFSSDAFMGESEQQNGVATPLDEAVRDSLIEPEDDFTSVKKSKKDKKVKKREASLLRGTVDDGMTTQPNPESYINFEGAEPSSFATVDRGFNEAAVAEPEDEFATVKKSKKDRKGKKRESIVPADESVPETSLQGNAPRADVVVRDTDQPPSIEAEDDFAPVKKSKKDKKGKKRDSLMPDTVEAVVVPAIDHSKEDEPILSTTQKNTISLEGPSQEATTLPAEDDFGVYTTKKSKKDKKNRKNAVDDDDLLPKPESGLTSTSNFLASDEPTTTDVTGTNSATNTIPESEDFGIGRKLSKKDKNRQSLLRSSTFDEPSEQLTETNELHPQTESRDLAETTMAAPSEEPQEDEFEFTSKKSKKDKKKQKNSRQASLAADVPVEEETPSSTQPDFINSQPLEKSMEHSALNEVVPQSSNAESVAAHEVETSQAPIEAVEETPEDMFGEFAFTKKSKKDKKKRKDASKQDSDEASGFSTPMDPGTDLRPVDEPSLPLEDIPEKSVHEQEPALESPPITTDREILEEPLEEWGSFSSKMSKKDKKRKGSSKAGSEWPSGTSTPFEPASKPIDGVKSQLPTQDFQESIQTRKLVEEEPEDLPSSSKDFHEPIDEWAAVPIKTPKKDKKKRKPGLSTPVEEFVPALEQPAEENPEDLPSFSKDVQEPENEWGAVPVKTSKKDKKQRKSGLSTPVEGFVPEPEQRSEGNTDKSSTTRETIQEEALPANEPVSRDIEHSEPFTHEQHYTTIPTGLVEQQPETTETSSARDLEDTSVPIESKQNVSEPEAEWAAVPKKSKKDKKKRKSGLSTPIEEPISKDLNQEVLPETSHETTTQETLETSKNHDPAILPEPSATEPDAEWGSLSRKSSKKDKKKRKSGLSAPVEEPIMADIKEEMLPESSHRPVLAVNALDDVNTSADSTAHGQDILELSTAEPEGEWGSLSRKASKKDKKKKKSGFSTPIEETIPTESKDEVVAGPSQHFMAPDTTPEVVDLSAERAIQDQGATIPFEPSITEPEGEWGTLSRKTSKKDKKRKSGLTTRFEEPVIDQTPIPASAEFEKTLSEVSATQHQVTDTVEHATQDTVLEKDSNLSFTPTRDIPEEPVDESAFVTKRSKKEKKGKKAPQGNSQREQSSFISSGSSGPIDLFPKHDTREIAPEVLDKKSSSPEPIEGVEASKEAHALETSPDVDHDIHVDVFPSDLSRKSSKKDKRKRQATGIIGTDDSQSTVKAPVTSWADEVEEAEIVRDHPIIDDLAKDETLSHIPSTTESVAVDDFVRPSKKGKKGKKRNSSQVDPADIPHPPVRTDHTNEETTDKSSNATAFAAIAAGAGLTGVALFGKTKDSPEGTSTPESTTPVRKLSKKEKSKQSIDKRTPTNDVFDDPSLWEGEKPRAYEESRMQDDENDGFWSPPREEEQVHDTQATGHEETRPVNEHPARENKDNMASHITPQQLFPSFAPDAFSKLEKLDPMEEDTEHERERDFQPATASSTTRENKDVESQPKDSFYEFIAPRSGEITAGITSSLESKKYQDVPHQDNIAGPIGQPYHHEPLSAIVTTPPEEKDISFDRAPPITPEHISTPHGDFVESQDVDRSFHDSPIEYRQSTPLSSRKYARLSDLPVVHEETTELEQHHSGHHHDVTSHRDSAYESPIPLQKGFSDLHEHVRDSGVHLRDFSPADKVRGSVSSSDDAIARLSWPSVDEDTETVDLHKSQRPKVSSKKHDEDGKRFVEVHESSRPRGGKATDFYRSQRGSEEKTILHHDDGHSSRDTLPSQQTKEETHTELHRTPTVHGSRRSGQGSLVQQRLQKFESPDAVRSTPPRAGNIVKQRVQVLDTPDTQQVQKLGPETPDLPPPHKPAFETPGSQRSNKSQSSDRDSPEFQRSQKPKEYTGLTSAERPKAENTQGFANLETGVALAGAAALGFAAARKLSQEQRPGSAQSIRSTSGGVARLRTPDLHRPGSVTSNRSETPPLRRSDRKSADLRSLSQRSKPDLAKEAELAAITASASNTANPTANEGRVRAKDMADVYDGFGEGRMGSPRSPTRPHSMRRRQSMQVLELENRVEQLAADNRMLAEFKAQAERNLHANASTASALVEKDAEIDSLKRTLDWLQHEVTRLTEVNDGLSSASAEIARQHSDRYGILEIQHAQATRELQETRDAHSNLSSGVEGMVRSEVQKVVLEKDQEIAQLRAELDAAKEKIREMQRQILASKANEIEFLTVRDEDYFDNACQQLCQHVQQWVLRFSKFSDMRACRLTREINNDKTIDRLDNAILDGSDVDIYLADRVKRRDIFMSMTMTMVWEFIFTRYLFGMDREQRQKLKSLEKTLSEVGPEAAVHSWRATTLTLLSKRDAFKEQREQDTKAVVHAILETLSEILPPPSNLEAQIEEQLTRVMKAAVELSVEMRCQRAEYMMLPPLQPEYDANGDLASKVSFNAALMNERSGDTVSNEDLEAQKAVVRIVLFPLVVKKGDDSGEGDEEIVVCPAQVLVAKSKKARFTDTAQSNHSRMSMQSSMPADAGDGNVI